MLRQLFNKLTYKNKRKIMTNIRVRDLDSGKEYNLCEITADCCRERSIHPTTRSEPAVAQTTYATPQLLNESIEDWAERIGYPHLDKKVRLITRLPKAQTYDSYDVSDVEEIMERWPNRQIIGAFDVNGEFQKAPAYTNPRASSRFVDIN